MRIGASGALPFWVKSASTDGPTGKKVRGQREETVRSTKGALGEATEALGCLKETP